MSLEGLGAPQATDRLFFAVFPDAATAARIVQLADVLRSDCALRGKPLRSDRLHITLNHIGDFSGLPADIEAAAIAAGNRIRTPSLAVVFNRAASFGSQSRNRPLVLRMLPVTESLLTLQRDLGVAMTACGLGRHVERQFVPHVTLLYDDQLVADREIPVIDWQVSEFALVHSLLGRTEHRILARWPLVDHADA